MPGKSGVPLVVVVVTGAEEHEAPAVGRWAPEAVSVVCTVQVSVAESQSAERTWVSKRMLFVDAVADGRVLQVFPNVGAVGHALAARPRPQGNDRVKMLLRADSRIAEQVPGAADSVPALQDHVARAGFRSVIR